METICCVRLSFNTLKKKKDDNLKRTTSVECRERDRILNDEWNIMREAAECHRQVRKWAQQELKPGVNLYDFCEKLEALNRKLVKAKGFERGVAFPTGVSRNHIAAHYTPNPGDRNEILKENDVLKIDFGTQINGQIVDCAWTYTPNKVRYGPLLEAVQAATETGSPFFKFLFFFFFQHKKEFAKQGSMQDLQKLGNVFRKRWKRTKLRSTE